MTRGLGPSVSVRLVAPEEARVKHMMELNNLSEKKAIETIDRHDSGRARMLKRHFRVDINDPLLYDAVWNTGEVSMDEIASATVAMLEARAARK